MDLTRAQGWGLFFIVWSLVPLAGILSADSILHTALLAILSFSFVYFGISMVRSGSFTV